LFLTCHGKRWQGDGKAGMKIGGVIANLTGGAYLDISEGTYLHVITKGGRMGKLMVLRFHSEDPLDRSI